MAGSGTRRVEGRVRKVAKENMGERSRETAEKRNLYTKGETSEGIRNKKNYQPRKRTIEREYDQLFERLRERDVNLCGYVAEGEETAEARAGRGNGNTI